MGILHRFFRKRAAVLQTELRLLHRLGSAPRPTAVQWITTQACDLSCPHCYSHGGRREAGELSTEEARRLVVDELVRLGKPTLVLAGGEASLRSDFPEIVRYAAGCGVPWALHTHGGHVLRHREVFQTHRPEMVAVSLDGTRAWHDRFRGRAGSFDAAVDALRFLVQSGVPEVVAGTTVTRENGDHLMDLLPVVVATGVHGWGLHLMTPEGRGSHNLDLLPTPGQLRRIAAWARRLRGFVRVELDNEWGSAGPHDAFYRDDAFVCGAGRWACVVSATGEVMPCTTTDRDESQGNVRDRSLSLIWAEGFEAFRGTRDPLRSACDDCWLQTRHGVSCRKPAFGGDPHPSAVLAEMAS